MAVFKNRKEAGERLARELASLRGEKVIVFALPRGGVPVAYEIAQAIGAPLDLFFAHKIGHPYNPEYAVAAVTENGEIVGNSHELPLLGKEWLEREAAKERAKMRQKRALYLDGKKSHDPSGKVVIVVDDGIATGLTMEAALIDLKKGGAAKVILAVPVAPAATVDRLSAYADEVYVLFEPGEEEFLGSVGAYFSDFSQTTDEEVKALVQ
jgi:predicted phosphoribosyltransferase